MHRLHKNQAGFTLVEMVVALGVFAIIAVSMLGLYSSLIATTVIMKQKSIALSIASNQMEYIKSLPFSGLAVAGGSIYTTNPIPSTEVKTANNFKYTVKTSINYVDDAYDGCGSYPTTALKNQYCRNMPAPASAPTTDTNPQDYKIIHVTVFNAKGSKLAESDTQISAKVAETASTTGALFVKVIDGNGNPVSGANTRVYNSTTTPITDLNDSTDSNGIAIFYGLIPDSNAFDFNVTASKSGSSTLSTIIPSGTLQPTYSNIKIFTQQSSYATLTIRPQGANSLLVESTDTAGAALSNMKVYIKGGYKKYTSTANTAYYYDNLTPTDARPTTDAAGLTAVSNLVPGDYIFCGDLGLTSCTRGATTMYMVAAVPYSGSNSLNPVSVPEQSTPGDPGTAFTYGGSSYLQKVRLMFSTSSTFPRVLTVDPDNVDLSGSPLASFNFQLTGANLPCSATAASCSTVVTLTKGASTYPASCTGNSSGLVINCTSNLTGVTVGMLTLNVKANAQTLSMPALPMMGGLSVEP